MINNKVCSFIEATPLWWRKQTLASRLKWRINMFCLQQYTVIVIKGTTIQTLLIYSFYIDILP